MIREVLTLDQLRSMAPAEAAAVLATRRLDGASPPDAELLAAWLDLSPTHREAWTRTEAALRAFDGAGEDEIFAAMREAARNARPVRPARPARRAPLAAAAALVLVVAGALLTMFLVYRPGGPPPGTVVADGAVPGVRTFAAAKGPPAQHQLPDGSRMTLEGGSTVQVAYVAARRDLRLVEGRAHFDVAPDTARPFTVRAGDREVVAVGTQFDVRLDPGRVRVVLTEGRVAVSRATGREPPTMLEAGQQLDVQAGRAPVVSAADLEASRDWREGVVTFHDTLLSVAVADFNRTSKDQVLVRDPQVARLRISGRFQTADAERFGRALAQVHPVRIVRTGPHSFEIVAAR